MLLLELLFGMIEWYEEFACEIKGLSMASRTNKFMLGQWHGKTCTAKSDRETKMQRFIFAAGTLRLVKSQADKRDIRVFGYEVPLGPGGHRVDSADLLGYDEDWNLYIFELKRGKNNEDLLDVVDEINKYERYLNESKGQFVAEFRKNYFLNKLPVDIFQNTVKVIVAPNMFYASKANLHAVKKVAKQNSILLCCIPDKTTKYLCGDMDEIKGTPISFHMYRK